MLVFTVKTKTATDSDKKFQVNVPKMTKDILLRNHIEIMKLEKNAPLFFKAVVEAKNEDEKKALLKKITKKQLISDVYPYFLKVCEAAVTYKNNEGVTLTELYHNSQISIKAIEEIYYSIVGSYQNYTYSDSNKVVIKNEKGESEVWELPTELMKESTLIEFLEAAQYEHYMQSLKIGVYESIANIMTILLRPAGEVFDEKTSENRVELMLNQNMDVALQVAFFLQKQKTNYAKILTIFLNRSTQRDQAQQKQKK